MSLDLKNTENEFIQGLNKKLTTSKGISNKDIAALTDIVGENDNFYMLHENKDSTSISAFSVYNSDCCGCEPVLRIMESQVPRGKIYQTLVEAANSEINLERAKSSGAVIDESENEYFLNLDK